MIFFLKLCVILLGLTAPGYMLARAIRLEHSWVAAFPLSALFMVETIVFFALTGIPIRFGTMAIALLLCLACCQIVKNVQRPVSQEISSAPESSGLPPYLTVAILLIAASVLFTVTLRTTLFPLRGFDTSFRWEGLARAMLQYQSLDFYPPVSASDYSIYLYPDGIPPLVATIYWWIYATLKTPLPQVTSISITLQLAATMALSFYGTRAAFGSRSAWFSLLAICASPLLISGFAIGQETGFTALSVAGQLCFAWAAVRNPKVSTVIVAALFAALGALTRDYGPALALSGFAVLAWHRETRRYLPAFILTTVLLSSPWYLRNWAMTGNPFFSHRIPGGFNVNNVHAAIMDYYKEVFSFGQFDQTHWFKLFKHLFTGGFLVVFAGGFYSLVRWRNSAPLLITAGLVILLWIFSVGQTAGGVIFSTRVLTPMVQALTMSAGAAFSHLYRSNLRPRRLVDHAAAVGIVLFCGYSLISAAIYPFPSPFFFSASTSTLKNSLQQEMVENLEASDLPPTRVLMDLPFTAEIMKRESRFKPVMYWNPDVKFVFDQHLDPKEIQRRLQEMDIRLVFVDNKSPNNPFLTRFNFFRERSGWNLLLEHPNESAFYYFNSY